MRKNHHQKSYYRRGVHFVVIRRKILNAIKIFKLNLVATRDQITRICLLKKKKKLLLWSLIFDYFLHGLRLYNYTTN